MDAPPSGEGRSIPPELKISRSRSPVANMCPPFLCVSLFFALGFFPFMSLSVCGECNELLPIPIPMILPDVLPSVVWFCMCVYFLLVRDWDGGSSGVCMPTSEALLAAFVEGNCAAFTTKPYPVLLRRHWSVLPAP